MQAVADLDSVDQFAVDVGPAVGVADAGGIDAAPGGGVPLAAGPVGHPGVHREAIAGDEARQHDLLDQFDVGQGAAGVEALLGGVGAHGGGDALAQGQLGRGDGGVGLIGRDVVPAGADDVAADAVQQAVA